MAKKLTLDRVQYEEIRKKLKIRHPQDFAVVTKQMKGYWARSIHIFKRQPTTPEINAYEQEASQVKFKGTKAEVQGSRTNAANKLYNLLIEKAFDVPLSTYEIIEKSKFENGGLNEQESREQVPVLIKRAAIVDMIAEVYSASQIAEREGEDAEIDDEKEADSPRYQPPDSDTSSE